MSLILQNMLIIIKLMNKLQMNILKTLQFF